MAATAFLAAGKRRSRAPRRPGGGKPGALPPPGKHIGQHRRPHVPLEFGLTSALAYTLEGRRPTRLELKACFRGTSNYSRAPRFQGQLLLMGGLTVPAGFRWCSFTERLTARTVGQMLNEILNDGNCEPLPVWLFTYNTAPRSVAPAGISRRNSAAWFRNSTEGKDSPAENGGHRTQTRGVLTKLTPSTEAIVLGSRFQVPVDQSTSHLITGEFPASLYYKPLPFVHRVVFISRRTAAAIYLRVISPLC